MRQLVAGATVGQTLSDLQAGTVPKESKDVVVKLNKI